jgi:hypothetical protein
MEWFNHRPTEAGMYLRSNPPISHVGKQDVVELDGKLFTFSVSGEGELIPIKKISDRFWWFGPIPQPPWKKGE